MKCDQVSLILRCYDATRLLSPLLKVPPRPKTRHDYHPGEGPYDFWASEKPSENTVNIESPGPLGPSKSNHLEPQNSSESATFSISAILGSFGLFWTPPKLEREHHLAPFS